MNKIRDYAERIAKHKCWFRHDDFYIPVSTFNAYGEALIAELDRIESEKPDVYNEVRKMANIFGEAFSVDVRKRYTLNEAIKIAVGIFSQFSERYHQSRMEHMKKTGECEQYESCLEKFIEHWDKKSRMGES